MSILSDKQMKLLCLLDTQISSCRECNLYENGRAHPYWTPNSEYVIIGEAPGLDEVEQQTPFIGRAGRILWEMMKKFELYREQFLIINSVNCRPVDGKKNGKPKDEEMQLCKKWIRKYVKVINPEKILLLGSYAIRTTTGLDESVIKNNSQLTIYENFKAVKSVHPAFTIYSKGGIVLLEESIKQFKLL